MAGRFLKGRMGLAGAPGVVGSYPVAHRLQKRRRAADSILQLLRDHMRRVAAGDLHKMPSAVHGPVGG